MRKDRLNIDIRTESPNDHFDRLIDFAKALIAQHPEQSIYKCKDKLVKYRKIMNLSGNVYRVHVIEDQLRLSLGTNEPAAIIYQEGREYEAERS